MSKSAIRKSIDSAPAEEVHPVIRAIDRARDTQPSEPQSLAEKSGAKQANDPRLARAIYLETSGRSEEAQKLFGRIAYENPDNIEAWLWLAKIVTDVTQKRDCLEAVLKVDPDNETAKSALLKLAKRPDWKEPTAEEIPTPGASAIAANQRPAPGEAIPHTPEKNQFQGQYKTARALSTSKPKVVRSPKTPVEASGVSPKSIGENLKVALILAGVVFAAVWLLGQCSGSSSSQSPKTATADPAGQAAIRAVQNHSTVLADNMHKGIGLALTITEIEGHTTSIDGWYVSSASDHHAVYFRFYVDGARQSAEWWYYPSGSIVPRTEWAFVFMGQ